MTGPAAVRLPRPGTGVAAPREHLGHLRRDPARAPADIDPAVAQGDNAGRGGRVVAPYVTPAQVTGMGGPAIKLDGHAVLLIQDVAVLITPGTPGECLPGAWRQSVRPLDIAQIAMLKAGMDACPVGCQRLGEVTAPAQPVA